VANDIVKNHLLHIGVFAMDGFIFHLHPDRQSATADVIASAGGNVLAHKFKFRIRLATQQRPTCIPVHLTDTQAPALDSVSPAMDSCRHNVLDENALVPQPNSQTRLCQRSMFPSPLSHILTSYAYGPNLLTLLLP
jgi:hypothetical protein